MTKKLVAEFIGTFWLILGDVGVPCLLQRIRTLYWLSRMWLWRSALLCRPWPSPSATYRVAT
jgi:glycerol uptake facilitator-like aquaporin